MAWVNILQAVYPVGSVYFSTNSTSPATLIGGTWSAVTGGMLGLAGSTGVASSGATGGSLKISVEQMPSHTHTLIRTNSAGVESNDLGWWSSNASAGTDWLMYTGQTSGAWGTQTNSYTGGGKTTFPRTSRYIVGGARRSKRKAGDC